jgi:hypothetical protein
MNEVDHRLWTIRVIDQCIAESEGDLFAAISAARWIISNEPMPNIPAWAVTLQRELDLALSAYRPKVEAALSLIERVTS